MSLTPNFFDDDGSATAADVSLVRRSISFGQSKKAKAVNKLLAQVEKLREDFEREKRRLDAALIVHAAQIAPRELRVTALRTGVVRQLARFLDDRRLSKADKRTLRELLMEQLDEILAHVATPEADITALFQRLHGISFEEAIQSSLEDAKDEMSDLLDEMGLDIEVPDLRPDMTEDDVAATAARMFEGMREAYEAQVERESQRPKTKRQVREEQRAAERAARREQVRKISIGAIYKRLVKALHPDLEPDPAARERKSAVMQEVTTAYGANDLPRLLRLEFEWIDGAGADAARQTDETLNAYSEVLRAQAAELRAAVMELAFQPRYASLLDPQDPFGGPVDCAVEVRRLDVVIDGLAAGLERFNDERQALTEVRDLVREHRRVRRREYSRNCPF